MTKLLAAVIAAVLIAGTAVLISGSSEAHSTPVIAKSDRLDIKTYGASCSQATWPYYEAGCLRNTVGSARDGRSVRVVSTDRVR
jgi:hypothetical protein